MTDVMRLKSPVSRKRRSLKVLQARQHPDAHWINWFRRHPTLEFWVGPRALRIQKHYAAALRWNRPPRPAKQGGEG